MHTGGFDPFRHAEMLGIKVVHRLARKLNGLWVPDEHTIFLRLGLTAIQERSVLAHELAHACLGHREHGNAKHERQANTWAAIKLIDGDKLDRIRRISDDPNVWAFELGVTLELLEVFCSQQLLKM